MLQVIKSHIVIINYFFLISKGKINPVLFLNCLLYMHAFIGNRSFLVWQNSSFGLSTPTVFWQDLYNKYDAVYTMSYLR